MRFDNDWDVLAKHLGFTDERDMLEDLYETQELPISEIARRLEVGTATINRRLDQLGVCKRKRGGANRSGDQTLKLFRLDPRVVLSLRPKLLSELTGVSKPLCYKFQKSRILGGSDGLLHLEPGGGLREVQQVEPATPSVATSEEPGLP